jgi:hypothetical protein
LFQAAFVFQIQLLRGDFPHGCLRRIRD